MRYVSRISVLESYSMIQGFKDRKTQEFFEGRKIRDFQGFASQAARRLVV